MGSKRMLGIDAYKRGWIGIAVESAVTGAYFAEDIQTLIARAEADGSLAIVAIDMPIGLPDSGHRRADLMARGEIGPLWPSLFLTPVRNALLADDHAAASEINRELTGARNLHPGFRSQNEIVRGGAVGATNASACR